MTIPAKTEHFFVAWHGAAAKRGFTLIETVVSIAIFALISLILYGIYQGYFGTFDAQQTRVDTGRSARTIVREVERSARQADHIIASHTFAGTAVTSDTSSVVFELPSIDDAGDVIAGVYDYIGFYATGTNAYQAGDAGAGSVRMRGIKRLGDAVNAFTFTYNNTNLSQATSTDIDLITQSVVKGQTIQSHLHQAIRLRNI